MRRMAPDSGCGRVSRLGAGLLVIITALGPLGSLDLVTAAQNLTYSGYADALTTQTVDQAGNTLLEGLIIDSAETYILDKAQALGMDVTVELETRLRDGYPIPWSVKITGTATGSQKSMLTEYITENLGIPEDRQEW